MTKTRNKLKIMGLVLTLVMMVSLLGLFSLTASAEATATYDISTDNDASNNSFAALIADFNGTNTPNTSVTVIGSRAVADQAVSLTIPEGVTVNWEAELSDGGTAVGSDGLLILSGAGTLALGAKASISSASFGITVNGFTGSVTITEGSHVTITAGGNYGMSLGSASLHVASNTALAVSSSKWGIDLSDNDNFTIGSNTHIRIGGTQPTKYPSTVNSTYYRRAASSLENLETQKFEKGGGLSGARALEIITADHIGSYTFQDSSVHTLFCMPGCPLAVSNATANHSYAEGSNTCSECAVDTYNVWVNGVRVTGSNASDVLGDTDDGATVTYTPASDSTPATLTLNNAAITGVHVVGSYSCGIFSQEDLILWLEGSNSIVAEPTDENTTTYVFGVFVSGALTIDGTGSLTATSGNAQYTSFGIDGVTVTIKSGTVEVSTEGIAFRTAPDASGYTNPVCYYGSDKTAADTAG